MRRSNYIIKADVDGFPLVIQDVGPWDQYVSVTNNVENVVKELFDRGLLSRDRPLYYVDSEGSMDEILIEDKQFIGFRILPER